MTMDTQHRVGTLSTLAVMPSLAFLFRRKEGIGCPGIEGPLQHNGMDVWSGKAEGERSRFWDRREEMGSDEERARSSQGWESGGGRRKRRGGGGETGKGRGRLEDRGDTFGEVDIGALTLSKLPLPAFLSRKDPWDRMKSKVTSVPKCLLIVTHH